MRIGPTSVESWVGYRSQLQRLRQQAQSYANRTNGKELLQEALDEGALLFLSPDFSISLEDLQAQSFLAQVDMANVLADMGALRKELGRTVEREDPAKMQEAKDLYLSVFPKLNAIEREINIGEGAAKLAFDSVGVQPEQYGDAQKFLRLISPEAQAGYFSKEALQQEFLLEFESLLDHY